MAARTSLLLGPEVYAAAANASGPAAADVNLVAAGDGKRVLRGAAPLGRPTLDIHRAPRYTHVAMVTAFDHIHIYAADPERSLAFYVDLLGAERVGSVSASHGRTNQFVILGGQYIVVSEFPPGHGASEPPAVGDGAVKSGFGIAHIGLNVDNLDTLIGRLTGAGVHVHSDPNDGGPVRFVYFTAPDGLIVELTQYVLPAKLKPAAAALRVFNRGVHLTKRTIAKRMLSSLS